MGAADDAPPPSIATVFYGHSSFIAASISDALLRSGLWSLRVADPDPDADAGSGGSSVVMRTDLSNRAEVLSAVSGATTVFLVDPTLPSPHVSSAEADFYGLHRIVVGRVRIVLAACREAGVRRLVYTGSADVVFDGVHAVDGADESMPFPEMFFNILNELRAQAEKMILSANSKEGFSTCVLRASHVFGPRDQYLVPFLVREARLGHIEFIVGNGEIISDFIYVENVAHANICAEHALWSGETSIDGQPFFITNHKPVKTWEFICSMLEGLGYARPEVCLPLNMVLFATMLLQQLSRKLGSRCAFNSLLFATFACGLSCRRTFNASKAQKLIGYSPIVPLEDGIKLTVQSFSHLASERLYKRQTGHMGLSKADALLGSGVADLLLWRDEKKTFTCALVSFFLYYWFLLSGRTFISSTAKLFLLVSAVLFVHCNLPSSMFGFNVKKVSLSFEVSELTVQNFFMMVASIWNSGISTLKLVPEVYGWKDFFKVAVPLYVFKWMVSFPLSLLVGFGIALAFTMFFIFDQFETEILKLITAAFSGIKKLWCFLYFKLSSFLPV